MSARIRVVIVGAGPAGMAAASVAAECGCEVLLLDENPAPGGQLWRGASAAEPEKVAHGRVFAQWTARLNASGAELLTQTSVVDCPAPNLLRIETNGKGRDLCWDRLILATGARERFLPFPGWTLPGVTGVGGLQALVKYGLSVSGKRVVVAGAGPLLLAVAASLTRAGARIAGIFEQAPLAKLLRFGVKLTGTPAKLLEGAHDRWQTRSTPHRLGWWIKHALGAGRLESIVATNGRSEIAVACDLLACSFHLVPNIELAQLLGCRIQNGYVAVNAVQETSIGSVYCAGEPTAIGGLEKALLEGRMAGLAAAGRITDAARLLPRRQQLFRFAQRLDQAFALRAELRSVATPDTIVCRCEDVTRGELDTCGSGRAARMHLRCGMGPCQGRICGPATEFLFGWSAASPRPPLTPARIATLAQPPETELAHASSELDAS